MSNINDLKSSKRLSPSNIYPAKSIPVIFSIVEKEKLISRAEVIEFDIVHSGQIYKVGGICNVLTFPLFRNQGYGKKVIEAATNYIVSSGADIGILFCDPKFELFYASRGWEVIENSITRIGTPESYKPYGNIRMMLFVSEKGKNGRSAFTNQPMYIKHIW